MGGAVGVLGADGMDDDNGDGEETGDDNEGEGLDGGGGGREDDCCVAVDDDEVKAVGIRK